MASISRRDWVAPALAAFLAVACYLPALNGEPIAEDRALIFESPATRTPSAALASFTRPFWHGFKPVQPYYRPLPVLTWSIERWIAGPSPLAFHATNVALHALNAALAALLVLGLAKLGAPGSHGPGRSAKATDDPGFAFSMRRRLSASGATARHSRQTPTGPSAAVDSGLDVPVAAPPGWISAPATGAMLAGALVAAHPLHSEPVAALYGRPDLLATVGTLLFLNLAVGGRPLLSLLALAGALFSKESALLMPLLVPVAFATGAGWRKAAVESPRAPRSSRGGNRADHGDRRRRGPDTASSEIAARMKLPKRLWSLFGPGRPTRSRPEHESGTAGRHRLRAALLGVIAAGCVLGAHLLMRYVALGAFVQSTPPHALDNPLVQAGALERWQTPFAVVARTARIAIWPDRLCADRGFDTVPLASSPGDPWALAGAGILFLSIVSIAMLAARSSPWALPASAALLAWLPASNLIALAPVLMAERLSYMPSAFACVLAGGLCGALASLMGALSGDAMRLAPAGDRAGPNGQDRSVPAQEGASQGFGATMGQSNPPSRGVARTPPSAEPSGAKRPVPDSRGDASPGTFLRPSIRWLDSLVRPALVVLAISVLAGLAARTLVRASDFRTELSFYRSDTSQCPRSVKAHYNVGNVLARAGRHEEAVEAFARATAIDPTLAIGHSNRAASFLALRRLDEAELSYRQALAIDPSLVTARASLAGVLLMMGRLDEALTEAETALASNPSPSDAAQIRELVDRIRERLAAKVGASRTRRRGALATVASRRQGLCRSLRLPGSGFLPCVSVGSPRRSVEREERDPGAGPPEMLC